MGRIRQDGINVTGRQRQVLDLVVNGHSNGEIAEALGISLDGAKWHVRELMDRVGVESRDDLAEWWENERSARTRLGRLARLFVGTGLAKGPTVGAAAVALVAASMVVLGLALTRAGSTRDANEDVETRMSASDAEAVARQRLQSHLEMIGFDQHYQLAGHPLSAADFVVIGSEFHQQATHLPTGDGNRSYGYSTIPLDLWRFTFKVTGVDEPETAGEFNAVVIVRDDDGGSSVGGFWGNRLELAREGPQKLSEAELLAEIDDGDRHFEVTIWRSVNGWCQFITWVDGAGLGGHCGMSIRPFGPGHHLDVAGIHQNGAYVGALVAVVSRDVAAVRFTATDGSVSDYVPAGDPTLPLAAVALRPPAELGITLIEALAADGSLLAQHGQVTLNPP